MKTSGCNHPNNGNVTLSVYNVGKIDFKINALYVNGLSISTNFIPNTTIKVGDHAAIHASSSQTWISGVTYTFRVVTQSGSKFDTEYTAP